MKFLNKDTENNTNDVSEITSRKITERAQINLSTINYHFGSKDELLTTAVNKLIRDTADVYFQSTNSIEKSPRDKLRDFLVNICDIVVSYKKYTKEIMPYILLNEEFTQAIEVLPLVKECLNKNRSEEECKIISYELISFMQLIFYRSDTFKTFAGINIMNKKERDMLINMQIELLIR